MTHNAMLTTVDNPYDPFTQFQQWFLFDMEKGYNSCGLLARIENEVDRAIDEIIQYDFQNIFRKTTTSDRASA